MSQPITSVTTDLSVSKMYIQFRYLENFINKDSFLADHENQSLQFIDPCRRFDCECRSSGHHPYRFLESFRSSLPLPATKMEYFGMKSDQLLWFESHLASRSQHVVIGSNKSGSIFRSTKYFPERILKLYHSYVRNWLEYNSVRKPNSTHIEHWSATWYVLQL